MPTFRDASKGHWGYTDRPLKEEINVGSLQRIADACELMAKDRTQLELQAKHSREDENYWANEHDRIARSNAALRGQITKLKKQIEHLKASQA